MCTKIKLLSVLILLCSNLLAFAASDHPNGLAPQVQRIDGGQSALLSFDSGANTNIADESYRFFGQTLLNNQDSGFVLGLRNANSQFSVLSGQGEGSEFSGASGFGLDQTYFHGGAWQDYTYQGFDWNHQLTAAHSLGAGHVEIDSHHLDQRTADYLQWQTRGFSMAYTQVQRAGQAAAENIQLSYQLGDYSVQAQQFATRAGGELNALGLSWSGKSADEFGLRLSVKSNDLLQEGSSSRIMFSYERQLGYAFNQAQTKDGEADEGGPRVRPAVLVGAGVVALALAGSSGSDSQDSSERLSDQHSAARIALNSINPRSVRENREFGGYVYQTPDGRYVATNAIRGEVASVTLPFSLIPAGGQARASYHTHAGNDPRYDNENFSFTDIAGDQQFGIDGYLGTPLGAFLWHDEERNRVIRLGNIAN